MKVCPLCDRPLTANTTGAPHLWQRIAHYADGKRTVREIAKLAGTSIGMVRVQMVYMRRAGYEANGRQKTPTYVPTREEYDRFFAMRTQGMTYEQIGKRIGLSAPSARRRALRMVEVFGEMPGRRRDMKRDTASDYVRIRELRVDAQLPWKRVGAAVGMNQAYVARYFNELCKVYGG